jgi:hypothetical protein
MDDELVNELLARQIGPRFTRMQPQLHPSIDTKWRPIERAMAMLPDSTRDTMADIRVYPFLEPRRNASDFRIEATVDRAAPTPTINVNANGHSFKNASVGDNDGLKQLAALLVHEQYHVDHDRGEAPAYDAQISTLQRLGASKKLIDQILRARDEVVRR